MIAALLDLAAAAEPPETVTVHFVDPSARAHVNVLESALAEVQGLVVWVPPADLGAASIVLQQDVAAAVEAGRLGGANGWDTGSLTGEARRYVTALRTTDWVLIVQQTDDDLLVTALGKGQLYSRHDTLSVADLQPTGSAHDVAVSRLRRLFFGDDPPVPKVRVQLLTPFHTTAANLEETGARVTVTDGFDVRLDASHTIDEYPDALTCRWWQDGMLVEDKGCNVVVRAPPRAAPYEWRLVASDQSHRVTLAFSVVVEPRLSLLSESAPLQVLGRDQPLMLAVGVAAPLARSTESDTDRDHLLDAIELRVHRTDPTDEDTDNDGLSDGFEVRVGTDPRSKDTDGDGLSDWVELAATDPASRPTLPGAPPHPSADNTLGSSEIDHAAFTDLELRAMTVRTSPMDVDTDKDGIDDPTELSMGTSPWRPDIDGDGLSDGFERTHGSDPSSDDSDGDGLDDGTEVRLSGDARSATEYTAGTVVCSRGRDVGGTPEPHDADGDGLKDLREELLGTSPCRWDTDGDELSDWEEVLLGTSPVRADTDEDGIYDAEETLGLAGVRSDPIAPDTDLDGWYDGVDPEPTGCETVPPTAARRVRASVLGAAPAVYYQWDSAPDAEIPVTCAMLANLQNGDLSCRQDDTGTHATTRSGRISITTTLPGRYAMTATRIAYGVPSESADIEVIAAYSRYTDGDPFRLNERTLFHHEVRLGFTGTAGLGAPAAGLAAEWAPAGLTIGARVDVPYDRTQTNQVGSPSLRAEIGASFYELRAVLTPNLPQPKLVAWQPSFDEYVRFGMPIQPAATTPASIAWTAEIGGALSFGRSVVQVGAVLATHGGEPPEGKVAQLDVGVTARVAGRLAVQPMAAAQASRRDARAMVNAAIGASEMQPAVSRPVPPGWCEDLFVAADPGTPTGADDAPTNDPTEGRDTARDD
jgi:hypothetical protein